MLGETSNKSCLLVSLYLSFSVGNKRVKICLVLKENAVMGGFEFVSNDVRVYCWQRFFSKFCHQCWVEHFYEMKFQMYRRYSTKSDDDLSRLLIKRKTELKNGITCECLCDWSELEVLTLFYSEDEKGSVDDLSKHHLTSGKIFFKNRFAHRTMQCK